MEPPNNGGSPDSGYPTTEADPCLDDRIQMRIPQSGRDGLFACGHKPSMRLSELAANLQSKSLNAHRFDSVRFLILKGETPRSVGNSS